MANISQEYTRVLRKRKILPVDANSKNVKHACNVMIEHNYFRDDSKKRGRWPIREKTDVDISPTEQISTNVSDCNEQHNSLPEWLRNYKCPSDSDDIEDIEYKSLSQTLKIEFDKDLANENKKKKKYTYYLIPFNEIQLANEFNLEIINHNDLLSGQNIKSQFNNCDKSFNVSTNSEDLMDRIENNCSDVESPNTSLRYIQLTNPPVETELQSKINMNDKYVKEKLLHNKQIKHKTQRVEKSLCSIFKMSQNDLSTVSVDFTEISVKNEFSIEEKFLSHDVGSIEPLKVVNIISEAPENVLPPFEWIDLIYLAIKNSPKEYVSCYDVQTFSRFWFPYYYKKSWTKDIFSTLTYNQQYFLCSCSIMVNSCDMWTINNRFVDTLEAKLKSTIEKYGNGIKSGMKNPDQLCMLLKGYGIHNLGYNQNDLY